MIPADASQPRQLSDRDPILLWRDLPSGQREGLALLPRSCTRPGCPCREIHVEALTVDDNLVGISMNDERVWMYAMPGAVARGVSVLQAAVDVDSGTITTTDQAPSTSPGVAALAWLRAELAEGPLLLACLRRRFHLDKHLPVEPQPPRRFSWRRWNPGDRVCWQEVFPETPTEPIRVGSRVVAMREWYCANPGCDCTDVWIAAAEVLSSGDTRLLGSLGFDFASATPDTLRGLTEADSPVLADLWAQLKARHDVATHYGRRRRAVQAAASDGLMPTRRRASHRASVASAARDQAAVPRPDIPRNARCPCGSGLKYKRCCGKQHTT